MAAWLQALQAVIKEYQDLMKKRDGKKNSFMPLSIADTTTEIAKRKAAEAAAILGQRYASLNSGGSLTSSPGQYPNSTISHF